MNDGLPELGVDELGPRFELASTHQHQESDGKRPDGDRRQSRWMMHACTHCQVWRGKTVEQQTEDWRTLSSPHARVMA